jgi:hypothetical protein
MQIAANLEETLVKTDLGSETKEIVYNFACKIGASGAGRPGRGGGDFAAQRETRE